MHLAPEVEEEEEEEEEDKAIPKRWRYNKTQAK
jgi:hypothetical protein